MTDENPYVDRHSGPDEAIRGNGPFVPGSMVVVWLGSPRERYWGVVRELSPTGLSLRGIDLNSFDDFMSLCRQGEPAAPGEIFFPMHRIEKIELDLRNGDLPSLSERFASGTGQPSTAVFQERQIRSVPTR
jgi:hypothetical protein